MESLKCIICSPLPCEDTAILIPPEKVVENQMGILISICKYCMRIELTACGKVCSRNCSGRSKRNLLFAYSWPRGTSTLRFMKRGLCNCCGLALLLCDLPLWGLSSQATVTQSPSFPVHILSLNQIFWVQGSFAVPIPKLSQQLPGLEVG